jgi:hypothetical protein
MVVVLFILGAFFFLVVGRFPHGWFFFLAAK